MPSYRIPTAYDRPPLHRRASGLGLAVAVHVLVLLALIGVGYRPVPVSKPTGPLVIDLVPSQPEAAPAARPQSQEQEEQVSEAGASAKLPPPPIVIPMEPPITPEPKLDMIELTPTEFAAADIGKKPKTPRSGTSRSGSDSRQAGVGPNGQVLYSAEWVREPTNAELNGYLPSNWNSGWGEIACRTVSGHRVDDCIELASFPRGSRFASAIRQAAWQFRVRPPRKNGRELIGEWVQIRIDYTRVASR